MYEMVLVYLAEVVLFAVYVSRSLLFAFISSPIFTCHRGMVIMAISLRRWRLRLVAVSVFDCCKVSCDPRFPTGESSGASTEAIFADDAVGSKSLNKNF